jgi:anti-anti-sigma regulatory factor
MSDDGQRTGRQNAVLRYAGSLRCRPLPGPAADPGPEDWRFDILQAGAGIVVTEVAGEIDLRTVGMLRKRLFELTDAGFAHIIIDFENVRFCDAAGLGALVAAQNRLRERGDGRSRCRGGAADAAQAGAGQAGAAGQVSAAGRRDQHGRHDRTGAAGQRGQAAAAGPVGAISLARVRPAQRRLLHVAGLGKAFALYDSVPEAVRARRDPTSAPLR